MKAILMRWRLRGWQAWLWWQHTWWFQLAHAPLCTRFRADVLPLGRLRLCRSCTLLYGALFLTIFSLLWLRPDADLRLLLSAGLFPPLLLFSYPKLYRHLPRWFRDVTRFTTGIFLALFFSLFLSQWYWLAGITFLVLLAIFRIFKSSRRQVKGAECQGCPELGGSCVCSGYSRQADSIRAFRGALEEVWNRPEVVSLLVLQQQGTCKENAPIRG